MMKDGREKPYLNFAVFSNIKKRNIGIKNQELVLIR